MMSRSHSRIIIFHVFIQICVLLINHKSFTAAAKVEDKDRFKWAAPLPPDITTYEGCAATIEWAYNTSLGQPITTVITKSGSPPKSLLSKTMDLPPVTRGERYELAGNCGIRIRDVTAEDAGVYEVRVIFHDETNNVILFDKVHLDVRPFREAGSDGFPVFTCLSDDCYVEHKYSNSFRATGPAPIKLAVDVDVLTNQTCEAIGAEIHVTDQIHNITRVTPCNSTTCRREIVCHDEEYYSIEILITNGFLGSAFKQIVFLGMATTSSKAYGNLGYVGGFKENYIPGIVLFIIILIAVITGIVLLLILPRYMAWKHRLGKDADYSPVHSPDVMSSLAGLPTPDTPPILPSSGVPPGVSPGITGSNGWAGAGETLGYDVVDMKPPDGRVPEYERGIPLSRPAVPQTSEVETPQPMSPSAVGVPNQGHPSRSRPSSSQRAQTPDIPIMNHSPRLRPRSLTPKLNNSPSPRSPPSRSPRSPPGTDKQLSPRAKPVVPGMFPGRRKSPDIRRSPRDRPPIQKPRPRSHGPRIQSHGHDLPRKGRSRRPARSLSDPAHSPPPGQPPGFDLKPPPKPRRSPGVYQDSPGAGDDPILQPVREDQPHLTNNNLPPGKYPPPDPQGNPRLAAPPPQRSGAPQSRQAGTGEVSNPRQAAPPHVKGASQPRQPSPAHSRSPGIEPTGARPPLPRQPAPPLPRLPNVDESQAFKPTIWHNDSVTFMDESFSSVR